MKKLLQDIALTAVLKASQFVQWRRYRNVDEEMRQAFRWGRLVRTVAAGWATAADAVTGRATRPWRRPSPLALIIILSSV